jgi:hypothetical protein
MSSKKRCKKGLILRKGYTRTTRSGKRIRVKPTCVKDTGKRGRTKETEKVLPKLRPGKLSKFGYTLDKRADLRRRALMKASKSPRTKKPSKAKMLKTLRRVNVLKNYTKTSQPSNYKKYHADSKWLSKKYKQMPKKSGRGRRRRLRDPSKCPYYKGKGATSQLMLSD